MLRSGATLEAGKVFGISWFTKKKGAHDTLKNPVPRDRMGPVPLPIPSAYALIPYTPFSPNH